jgi:hypothetical protein
VARPAAGESKIDCGGQVELALTRRDLHDYPRASYGSEPTR